MVFLNKKDYTKKMEAILQNKEKFAKLGDVETQDKTAKLERKIQKRLLELVNSKVLATEIYDRIRPTGSQRPQMYGLPKIHKPNVPLRPILSMIGLAQHELAKWLSEVLDPVLQKYSKHCIKDSFTFAEFMQKLNIENETSFMCSFDISSLFTNVPLSETIKICADALYRSELNSPPFPEEVFIELMETATRSVEFSFNNEMYQQRMVSLWVALWDLPWPISLLAFMKSVCSTTTKSQVSIFGMWMTHIPFSKQRLSVILF